MTINNSLVFQKILYFSLSIIIFFPILGWDKKSKQVLFIYISDLDFLDLKILICWVVLSKKIYKNISQLLIDGSSKFL